MKELIERGELPLARFSLHHVASLPPCFFLSCVLLFLISLPLVFCLSLSLSLSFSLFLLGPLLGGPGGVPGGVLGTCWGVL